MKMFAVMREKHIATYQRTIMKIKKGKSTRKCVIRQKHKFKDYKNFLEGTQHENKIIQLEKKPDVDSLRKNHKEFTKNKKLILKLQQIFRSKKHNVFTEEVNKIVLSANNDKRIIEAYEICIWNIQKSIMYERRN